MKKQLYDVQEKHADVLAKALENFRSALDGSATGTGKTLIAAELSSRAGIPTLVVAPKSSITMWEKELEARNCTRLGVINYEMLRTGRTEFGEYPTSSDKIWRWKLPSEETLIIWDEVQKAKGMNTQNARILWTAKPYYNLCLSATAAKDPTEMKALGSILGLFELRNFWFWAKQHGCKPGYFGGLEFVGKEEDINALHQSIYPDHGSRLTVKDLAHLFPEGEIITTPLDFGKELEEIYISMENELQELADKKQEDSKGAEALTIRLRARQKVELLKIPTILELIENLYEEGRSIVVFLNFNASLKALRDRIPQEWGVGEISGSNVKHRHKDIDDFTKDKKRIMLCNIQAGGVSVNLHDTRGKFPRTGIINPTDNEKDVAQALGRCYRVGCKTFVQQIILFANNTVEACVEQNFRKKLQQLEIFNHGL